MPIPIIPIAAVLGAGTLGFFIGRDTAPRPASVICSGDANEDEHEDEETLTAVHSPGNGGEESKPEEGETGTVWTSMSRAEALDVLGLASDATPDAIREAHQRLIQRIHPDQGGSRYLTAAVDHAKAVLLG